MREAAASLRSELPRKIVHIGMGGFALLLRWTTPAQAALLAAGALAFNLLVLHRLTRGMLLRPHERPAGRSAGIVLYPAAVLAVILVFHDRLELAAAVWGLLAFGDGMATLGGVLVRGPRLPWNPHKTWSGLVAFTLYGTAAAAFLVRWTQRAVLDGGGEVSHVGLSFYGGAAAAPLSDTDLLILACFAVAVATAFVESLDTGLDDNLLVPLAGGALLYAATLVEPARLAAAAGPLANELARGAAVTSVLAVAAWAARGVTPSGAFSGWLLGTALYGLAGWRGFLLLALFFALGTAATRLGHDRKTALGVARERGGRRGAPSVFANASAGVLFAGLTVATAHPEAFRIAMVGAFATAAADTVSSEVGQAFGGRARLVTTFRAVPPGTAGAVSPAGTLAGVLASLLLALAAWTAGLIGSPALPVVVAAAFAGTTLESYLAAALDGARPACHGLLNFTNTVAGGIAALALWSLVR